jgi:predicted SprT family Zn-dependent metalloprotease
MNKEVIRMNRTRPSDTTAIIDLSWELIQQEMKSRPMTMLGYKKPVVKIKDIQGGGRYSDKTDTITLPKWIFKNSEEFVIYYIVHELCHTYYSGHPREFKRLEQAVLSKWDIEIEYAKAYPKYLYSNGVEVYESWRELKKKNRK